MENSVIDKPSNEPTLQNRPDCRARCTAGNASKGPVSEVPILIRTADGAQIKATWFAGKDAQTTVVFFPAMGVEAVLPSTVLKHSRRRFQCFAGRFARTMANIV